MKYEIDLHEKHFSKKLTDMMQYMGLVDKKGNPCPIALYNKLYPEDFISEDMIKEDRQRITDKTRKCRNWINGKNFPKDIKDVLLLCKKLECDLDYFFTDMPCSTHNIQFIHECIGLSENAIKCLESFNKSNSNLKEHIVSLDRLLNMNSFLFTLLGNLTDYSFKHAAYIDGRKILEKETTELNNLSKGDVAKEIELLSSEKYQRTMTSAKLKELKEKMNVSRYIANSTFSTVLDTFTDTENSNSKTQRIQK